MKYVKIQARIIYKGSEIMKKKIIQCFIGVAVVATLFIGCQKSGNGTTAPSTNQEQTITPKEGPLNIAIITDPSGLDDGSFNTSCNKGITRFIETSPEATVTPFIIESFEKKEALSKLKEICSSNYDVIVCCGSQFSEIGAISNDYKDTEFILVDAYPQDENGTDLTCNNVYGMKFSEQESGFCAGIAAALETTTKKVAVIAGRPESSVLNYQRGFHAGVDYANKHYETDASIITISDYWGKSDSGEELQGNFIQSYNDQERGKVIAEALIAKDVDILFTVAGNSGKGVFDATKSMLSTKPNLKVIGCDADQYDLGAWNDKNIVLTSAIKGLDINIKKQLDSIQAGKFQGQNVLLRADTYSTGYISEFGRHQLSEDTVNKINDAFSLIKDGTIELP